MNKNIIKNTNIIKFKLKII